jgi:hypothetical protein
MIAQSLHCPSHTVALPGARDSRVSTLPLPHQHNLVNRVASSPFFGIHIRDLDLADHHPLFRLCSPPSLSVFFVVFPLIWFFCDWLWLA